MIRRKPKRRPIVRKVTLCRSLCIQPYIPCVRCTAILHRTIGLQHYRLCSWLTIRLLARRCMKRRSSRSLGYKQDYPIDIIFGIPHVGRSTTTGEFAHSTRENLQIAFKLARGNLFERLVKQKANNSKLPTISEFTPRQKVLVYKPHQSIDGPNPKLIQPWRGPYIICSELSPVVYQIRLPNDMKQVSVHLAHVKTYRPRQSAPAPDFHKPEELFLGKTLSAPASEESETVPSHIGIYQVAHVVGHRCGQGRHNPIIIYLLSTTKRLWPRSWPQIPSSPGPPMSRTYCSIPRSTST